MRAATLAGPGVVRVADVEPPEPGPGQVRVRVEGCGICGSNLPVWEGRPWFEYPLAPGAPGHEGWGFVDAVGDGVAEARGGSDRGRAGEAGPSAVPDRPPAEGGGVGADGPRVGQRVAFLSWNAFAEYDVAAADAVVPLPPSLDGRPFPGEALACAVNVVRRAGIEAGARVAVVGIGFLGAVVARLAAARGARVVALSRRAWARDVAERLGAEAVLPLEAEPSRSAAAVSDALGGGLCDVVIEATGLQHPLDVAAELTRERGRLVIAGYHQDGRREVDLRLWNWRGLDVVNAHERDPAEYVRGMRDAVDAVARGVLDPDPLLTHGVPLDALADGFRAAVERPDGFLKAWVRT